MATEIAIERMLRFLAARRRRRRRLVHLGGVDLAVIRTAAARALPLSPVLEFKPADGAGLEATLQETLDSVNPPLILPGYDVVRLGGATTWTGLPVVAVLGPLGGALVTVNQRWSTVVGSALVIVCLVYAGMVTYRAYAARRLVRQSMKQVGGSDDDAGTRRDRRLAGAFLTGLTRHWDQWRRMIMPRKLRSTLPVILVRYGTDPVNPVADILLDEFVRTGGRWRWFRRPPAVVITDRVLDDHRPVDEWRTLRSTDGPWAFGPARSTMSRRRRLPVSGWTWPCRYPAPRLSAIVCVVILLPSYLVLGQAVNPYCFGQDRLGEITGEPVGVLMCGQVHEIGGDLLNGARRWSGITTGPRLFDPNEIFLENKRVERELARDGRKGSVIVVLITSLTRGPGGTRSLVADFEGLAGAYAAQRRINANRDSRRPYLRLALANVGDLGENIPDRDREAKLRLMTDGVKQLMDAPGNRVIGALVTIESRVQTRDRLIELARRELPLITPTMTADSPEFRSPELVGSGRFFQFTSTNEDQVALIREFAAKRASKSKFIPIQAGDDPNDLYVRGLIGALDRLRVAEARTATPQIQEAKKWRSGSGVADLAGVCSQVNTPRPVVFFAGRFTSFPEFVVDLQRACGSAMPLLIASDSVSRFLAASDRIEDIPNGTEVVIPHRGMLLSCVNLRENRSGQDDGSRMSAGRRTDFLEDVTNHLGRCRSDTPDETEKWLAGGWAALNYDTLRLLDDGLSRALPSARVGDIPPKEIRDRLAGLLTADGLSKTAHSYPGAFGVISPDEHRIARRQSTLYCLPELNKAFDDGGPATRAQVVGTRDQRDTVIPPGKACGP